MPELGIEEKHFIGRVRSRPGGDDGPAPAQVR